MKKLFIVLAAMLTFTSTAFAQIGSLSSDLVYTPVAPCRIFDTRPAFGGTGAIAAGGTKDFQIWGAVNYVGQGGAGTNCGITAGINTAAVAVNLTVVTPGTAGYITAYPFGTTRPTAATVNFNAGDVRGNFAIAKNAQAGVNNLTIFSTSFVDVVGDVVGYYAKPVSGLLDCITTAEVTLDIIAGGTGALAIPACPAGYSNNGGQCYTDSPDMQAMYGRNTCAVKNVGTATGTIISSRRCCRIPGR